MMILLKKILYRASYVTSIHIYIWSYVLKDIARNKRIVTMIYAIFMQSFGSQSWDTSFTIEALLASDLINEIGPVLARGHDYIKKSQV